MPISYNSAGVFYRKFIIFLTRSHLFPVIELKYFVLKLNQLKDF